MKKLLLLFFIGVLTAIGQTVQNGDELLKTMHERYAGKWYKTLTFVQKTTRIRADSTISTSTWYEAFSFPGTMRIDIDRSNLQTRWQRSNDRRVHRAASQPPA